MNNSKHASVSISQLVITFIGVFIALCVIFEIFLAVRFNVEQESTKMHKYMATIDSINNDEVMLKVGTSTYQENNDFKLKKDVFKVKLINTSGKERPILNEIFKIYLKPNNEIVIVSKPDTYYSREKQFTIEQNPELIAVVSKNKTLQEVDNEQEAEKKKLRNERFFP